MRFLLAPSAHPGRDAICSPGGGHAFRDHPASTFARSTARAVRRPVRWSSSPLRFSHARDTSRDCFTLVFARRFSLERQAMRCCSARGATCLTSNPFGRASQARRLMGSFVQLFRRLRSFVRTPSENPIDSRTRTIPSTSSAAALPDAGPIRVMRRHVPACGVPLPAQKIRPSRPGRAGRSSLDYSPARQRSWGFKSSSLCPSQVCSR